MQKQNKVPDYSDENMEEDTYIGLFGGGNVTDISIIHNVKWDKNIIFRLVNWLHYYQNDTPRKATEPNQVNVDIEKVKLILKCISHRENGSVEPFDHPPTAA